LRAGAAVAVRLASTSRLVRGECLQVGLLRVDAVALPSAGLSQYADPFQHINRLARGGRGGAE